MDWPSQCGQKRVQRIKEEKEALKNEKEEKEDIMELLLASSSNTPKKRKRKRDDNDNGNNSDDEDSCEQIFKKQKTMKEMLKENNVPLKFYAMMKAFEKYQKVMNELK